MTHEMWVSRSITTMRWRGNVVFVFPTSNLSMAGTSPLADSTYHCKNFSFLVTIRDNNWKWHLAPAYDLTLCTEGYNGEHATSVNGTGHPSIKDFIAVGTKIKMKEQLCREIIDEVKFNCKELTRYTIPI